MNVGTIDLWRIPKILREKIKWIGASAAVCGLIMFFISTVLIKPTYTADVSLYIYSSTDRVQTESEEITSSELSASQLLVDTYIVILQSDTVMNKVIDELNLDCTASSLKERVSASAINNTEVLSVTIKDQDPEQAQQIANVIAEVLPKELVRVVKAGGVEVIDYAKVPENPSSPNVTINVLAGILFGFFFSCGVVILADYFNTKVKGEEDLQAAFDIPVLGIIPMLGDVKESTHGKK